MSVINRSARQATRLLFCFIGLIILSIAFYLGALFFHKDFGLNDFRYRYPLSLRAEVSLSPKGMEEVKTILSQRFTYLDMGKQMSAFESEDHQYVLKFFNPRPFIKRDTFYQIKKLKSLVSMKWLSYAYFHRKDRLMRLANIYIEAFDDFKEESALVFVSANHSSFSSKEVVVVDQEGCQLVIDISQYPFVLQRRVKVAQNHMLSLIREGKIAEAKICIQSLADLFAQRAFKGYTDRIQTLHNNYGFDGIRAVQIDLGRLRRYELSKDSLEKELARVFCQLEDSIAMVIPELQTYAHDLLQEKRSAFLEKCPFKEDHVEAM